MVFSGIFTLEDVNKVLPNIEQYKPRLNNMISDQIALEHLNKIETDKSTEPDDMIPRVLLN